MPLWTDAYIGDTAHLTNEEHGVYLRLLMFAWRSPGCCLPDDDKRLALMVGVTPKKWAALRPVISQFWRVGDGRWTQKRLTAEREKVQGRSEKAEAAAEERWRLNALKNNKPANADASLKHYAKDMPPECSPSPPPKEDPDPEPAREMRTFRERLLEACGADPVSGMTGRGGNRLGTQTDMILVKGWLSMGLTPEEILAEAADVVSRKRDGPPNSFKYLNDAMGQLAAAKAAPPPEIPAINHPPKGPTHARTPLRPDRRADDLTTDPALRAIAIAATMR